MMFSHLGHFSFDTHFLLMQHLTKITSTMQIFQSYLQLNYSLYLQQFLIIKHKRMLCGRRKPSLEVSYCNVIHRE